MAAPPVETRGLTKRYGDLVALDGIDLLVEPGDVYGFLGPNGAGKTTMLRVLLGLVRPDEGTARIFGRDPSADAVAALADAGGFVEAPTFYDYLSGRANLELLAALDRRDGAGRIDGALETVGLRGREDDTVGDYSHGMKQRLGVAATLVRDPSLIVLDEPTTGLDPPAMRDMRGLVRRLAAEGRTILLSSHLMNEVEELCNRVAIIRRGAIVFEGTLVELLERTGAPRFRLRAGDPERARALLASDGGLTLEPPLDGAAAGGELTLSGDEEAVDRFTVALGRAGVPIRSLTPERPSLEEAFFRMTEGEEPAGRAA